MKKFLLFMLFFVFATSTAYAFYSYPYPDANSPNYLQELQKKNVMDELQRNIEEQNRQINQQTQELQRQTSLLQQQKQNSIAPPVEQQQTQQIINDAAFISECIKRNI